VGNQLRPGRRRRLCEPLSNSWKETCDRNRKRVFVAQRVCDVRMLNNQRAVFELVLFWKQDAGFVNVAADSSPMNQIQKNQVGPEA
jgi:hypothetical protein